MTTEKYALEIWSSSETEASIAVFPVIQKQNATFQILVPDFVSSFLPVLLFEEHHSTTEWFESRPATQEIFSGLSLGTWGDCRMERF